MEREAAGKWTNSHSPCPTVPPHQLTPVLYKSPLSAVRGSEIQLPLSIPSPQPLSSLVKHNREAGANRLFASVGLMGLYIGFES